MKRRKKVIWTLLIFAGLISSAMGYKYLWYHALSDQLVKWIKIPYCLQMIGGRIPNSDIEKNRGYTWCCLSHN